MPLTAIPLFKVFTPVAAHAALKPVLESGQLAASGQVAAFESQLAKWLGVPHAVALNDAAGAIVLALSLSGVRPGDEVIVSPMACAATLMPIANLFARPVWCDVDPHTGMMDANKIAALITEKTRAVLHYHWSGDVADISALAAATRKHGIKLIEDASEAFGAEYQGRRLGGIADYTVYSFYATKHINTGEGAALLAASHVDIAAIRRLRRFGIEHSSLRLANGDLNPDFDIPVAGFNFAMNEIAATLGLEGLRHADEVVAKYRANGRYYESALSGVSGLRKISRSEDSFSGFWTYALLVERRNDLIRKLASHGIGAQRLHIRGDGYSCFGGIQRELPGVVEFNARNLSIPSGWWVGEEERTRIADCIRAGW